MGQSLLGFIKLLRISVEVVYNVVQPFSFSSSTVILCVL